MNEKIKIDYGKYWLVCEQNPDPTPEYHKEVWVYLEEKDTGVIWQDITVIRPSTSIGDVECLIYGNPNKEDYTHRFLISFHEEEN